MIKHIKKGLLIAGILAAVLSLAGCPKEAGGNGGGNGFSINSIVGTWICSPYSNNDESVVITTNSIKITRYNTSTGYSSIRFEGDIVKTLTKGNYAAIIGKNSSGKYKGYYLRNINNNTSFEVGRWNGDETYNTLEEAENEFLNANDFVFNNCDFHTYLYQ